MDAVKDNARERGHRKLREGVVVSRSGSKSIVVQVERRKQHPLYGKIMRERRKFHVHDEGDQAGPGDRVSIMETRPMSKMKHWRLVEVLEKGSEV